MDTEKLASTEAEQQAQFVLETHDEAYREQTATLLQVLGRSPCGLPRRHAKQTLYDFIRDRGVPQEYVRVMSLILVRAKTLKRKLNKLKKQKNSIQKTSSEKRPRDDLDRQLAIAMKTYAPELFFDFLGRHDRSIGTNLEREFRERAVAVFADEAAAEKSRAARNKAYSRMIGVPEDHTNTPKLWLDSATFCPCTIFTMFGKGPQYGIVGQMLYRAGLDQVDHRDVVGLKNKEAVIYKRLYERARGRMKKPGIARVTHDWLNGLLG